MALWTMNDEDAGKPKYLNAADKASTIGVDVAEAADAGSIAKGLTTPGWVKYATYTDAQGNTRHKSEVLVAASSMASDGTATLVDDLAGGGGGAITWGVTANPSTYTVDGFGIGGMGMPGPAEFVVNLSSYPGNAATLLAYPVGTVFTVAAGTGITVGDTFTLTSSITNTGPGEYNAQVTYAGAGYMMGSANVAQFTVA